MSYEGVRGNKVPPITRDEFRKILNRPLISSSSFFSSEFAEWDGENYTLGKSFDKSKINPSRFGVRLQEPDPTKIDITRQKDCQDDLVRLIRSIKELRKDERLQSLVLSNESFTNKDPSKEYCKRVVFGLRCPSNNQYRSDTEGASECYNQITKILNKAGYELEPQSTFDSNRGFQGLEDWVGTLRLRRKKQFSKWLLLLLIPLLLLLLPMTCQRNEPEPKPTVFMGMPVDTDSFIILVDKSGSVEPYFGKIRTEAKRFMEERALATRKRKTNSYANIISYDGNAYSALGKMSELTDFNIGKLDGYLDSLKASGDTNLKSAIDEAFKEISVHGKNTTILILTDGEDRSIPSIISNKDNLLESCPGVKILCNATTPRLFDNNEDPQPINSNENSLTELSKSFGGKFGYTKEAIK